MTQDAEQSDLQPRLRILTNMAFWQSPVWAESVMSIHPDHGKHLGREPAWWHQALQLYRKQNHADVVLTLGVRESMAYGLLCWLTGRPSKQIMTEVFIDEPSSSLTWRMKTWLYGMIARRCLGLLTNSSAEINTVSERYHIPVDNLIFVPLNSTLADAALSDKDDGFILSAGRTLRDYPTLITATQDMNIPVHIVCGTHDVFSDPLPGHITVYRELSLPDYINAIARCTLLALPLQPTGRSTGQVVMLDAMALGKPVIVTRLAGTVDYIRHGENGLLVPPGDPMALRSAILELLNNASLRKNIGLNAWRDVQSLYTFDRHARLKLKAIHDLHRFNTVKPTK